MMSKASSRAGSVWLAAVTLALCTFTQCVCQNSRDDKPPTADAVVVPDKKDAGSTAPVAKVELPKSVDPKDLDNAERKLLRGVLTEQFDPCGSPRSFLESLKDAKPCERAVQLGAKAVKLVAKGLSKRQVTSELLKALQRMSNKAEFEFDGSPYFGDPAAAKIVIVKFTDFQCPYCKIASQPLKDLANKYKAVLYIKHLPLSQHKHAKEAAMASLAALRQGKFWEVYKLFFDNQEQLDPSVIRSLIIKAGVDMKRYDTDLKSPELAALVARDGEEADKYKVDGTPSIFVDGILVEYDNLEEVLKEKQ